LKSQVSLDACQAGYRRSPDQQALPVEAKLRNGWYVTCGPGIIVRRCWAFYPPPGVL
jgi:hypothetical protein